MTIVIEHQAPAISLTSISHGTQAGRWRTEAMRSHATPRLIYITKGQGRVTVAGLTTGYGPNNLIYIPPHTMYGIEVGPTVFGQILSIPSSTENEWPKVPAHLRLRDVLFQKELLGLFEALERELKAPDDIHARAAQCHLGLLAIYFERQLAMREPESNDQRSKSAAARLVARYTDLIAQDFRSDKCVTDYASALSVTPTHLTRCCKQTCDKSALALLNDRIHYEACILLRDTRTPVQEIAKALGFQSAAYFTRSFQSKSGQTPSDFRRTGREPMPTH